MKRLLLTSITAFTVFMFSCENKNTEQYSDTKVDTPSTPEVTIDTLILRNGKISLTEVLGSPTFPDSKLKLVSPKPNDQLELGSADFKFSIDGGKYILGSQSEDAETKGCANSGKGQHIHIILDNEPYEASYDSLYTTKRELEAGNHVALAFISRSYHESLKHEGAYTLSQFKVGEEEMDSIDLSAEHLFYSRPKGSYTAKNTEKVMLDFYLTNTTISENGNYVKATFNDSTDFKITKWVPYFIKGLPMGVNKVQLELMDKDNNLIKGPFNEVVREFTLTH